MGCHGLGVSKEIIGSQRRLHRSIFSLYRAMLLTLIVGGLLGSATVAATCSSYLGHASINEVHRNGNSSRFVELKILDTSITSAVYNTWTLRLCNYQASCSNAISLTNATNSYPWLVIPMASITSQNYIDLSNGMDAILRDGGGNTIDYLSVVDYTGQRDNSCVLPLGSTMTTTNSSTIERYPDGTGNWRDAGSGNSGGASSGATNDENPSGGAAVTVTVNNVSVVKGQTATFTFSIGAAVAYPISVQYQTQDNTAVAGTDYTANSGTATIPTGATSTTVSVPTNAASSSGQVLFYLYLSNQVNGTLANSYPSGTILPNPLAAWRFEEASWSGSANEVVDSSGNGYNGTATNGPTTANTTPAIAGSPGTCRYGGFDGNNDYIALNNFPNLTGSFTLTAWIRANRITGDQRIFADDQNNSGGYALSLGDSDNGMLRFFSRNISPVSIDSPIVISTGSWFHVAAVHNAGTKTRQIFVNGAAVTGALTYTGTWGTDSGAASIGGENNASGEGNNQYRFNGLIDEVRIYNSALDAAAITAVKNDTRSCGSGSLHHLQIQHDGTALTCNPEAITVRACADSTCSSLYSGNVSVTLTPSGWVGGNTQTISGGSGSLQLRLSSAQTVSLGVSSSTPAASNNVVCLNTATNTNSCALTYYDTGFIYTVPPQISCTPSAAITVSAVRLDNSSQQCVPSFQSRSANVNFWSSYASPSSGTRPLTLNNGSANYTLATASPGTSVALNFNNSGQASVTLTYNDAGQLTLNSQFTGSGSEAGLVMNGASSYVTTPYKFYVYSDDANSDCAGASATCSVFKRAGETFNLKIRAACADNSVTPNFQLNGITLTHTNNAPAMAPGSLGVASFNSSAGDAGEHVVANQTVSEVGVFTFTAMAPAGGYFGNLIGDGNLNSSTYIGRFIPDHFCLSNNSIVNRTDSNSAAGCTDTFNFLDEDFDLRYRLSAQTLGAVCSDGTLTQNYSGAWSKLSTPFNDNTTVATEPGKFNLGAVNDPGGTPTNLNSRIAINSAASTPASGLFSNGVIDVSARLHINRSGSAPSYTPEAAFNQVALGLNPIDTDNVRIDSTNLNIGTDNYRLAANTILYFGRLYADNAYGPETLALPMWAQTQYCNTVVAGACSSWTKIVTDSCTLFTVTPPAQTALGSTSTGDGKGYYRRAAPSVSSGSYDYTGSSGRVHVPDSFNHSAGWQLFYTGGGNGGDYLLPFVSHPYLRTQNATASFGQFRGDDRIIYWREILQ